MGGAQSAEAVGGASASASATASASASASAAVPGSACARCGGSDASLLRAAAALLDCDDASVPDDGELKMVLCVVGDLGMSKGKVAAQVGHAVLALWLAATSGAGTDGRWLAWARAWHFRAAAKITLRCAAAEVDALAAAAAAAGLPTCVIEDAGRTEIPAGSRTVVGIGPAPRTLIDAVTGPRGAIPLKLLT